MSRILVYGSSSTLGFHDPERGGWAERLKQSYLARYLTREKPRADVHNLATCGRLFPSILASMENDLAVYGDGGPTVAAFMVGVSDSRIQPGQSKSVVELAEFKAGLARLAEICATHAVRPVFVGLSPIDDAKTHPFLSGETFDTDLRKEYEALVQDHAKAVGAPFIPIWDRLGGDNAMAEGVLVEWEGLHMNSAGHRIVHDLVFPVIDNELRIVRGMEPLANITTIPAGISQDSHTLVA